MSHFSKTLKLLRKEQHLTQQQLAECLNVSKSRINMYERGERQPNFEMLNIFALFFKVDMNTLLGNPFEETKNGFKPKTDQILYAIKSGLSPKEILILNTIFKSRNYNMKIELTSYERGKIEENLGLFDQLSKLTEAELFKLLNDIIYYTSNKNKSLPAHK